MIYSRSQTIRRIFPSLMAIAMCLVLTIGCEQDNADSGGGSGSVITQAEYNDIQRGMSYTQVVAIVGANGTEISNNGGGLIAYQWANDNGSFAQVTISNNSGYGGIGVIAKLNSGNLP